MTSQLQFKRSARIQFGALSTVQPFELEVPAPMPTIENIDDNGVRISFDLSRTSSGVPDKGIVQIWNLTRKTADSIVADMEHLTAARTQAFKKAGEPPRTPDDVLTATLKKINDGYTIKVFAGYQGRPEQVFLGEYVDAVARRRVSETDHVTEITLGDTFTSLRDGFLSQPLGLGVTIPQFLQEFSNATAIKTSADAAARIAAVAPTASITLFQNGAAGGIRAAEMMDDISDLLDHTWFVREGELYLLPEGSAIQDFSIILQQGKDILDFSSLKGFNDIQATALINARIEPGRGIIVLDEFGKRVGNGLGFVVRDARYVFDTHGPSATVQFTATAATELLPIPDASGII